MAAGPHKNWMVVVCGHEDTYHLYVERKMTRCSYSIICGPQWKGRCEAYDTLADDHVKFTYDKEDRVFHVEFTDANNAIKQWVQSPGMLVSALFRTHIVKYI